MGAKITRNAKEIIVEYDTLSFEDFIDMLEEAQAEGLTLEETIKTMKEALSIANKKADKDIEGGE
jgi:pilus assembly protein TadC